MDNQKFVAMVKREAVDGTVAHIFKTLKNPRSPKPSLVRGSGDLDDLISASLDKRFNDGALLEQRQAAWFSRLDKEGQEILQELLQECAEVTAFHFFNLIDGTGGDFEGVFEIIAVSSDEDKVTINPENTDMLHDLFSDVCEADRNRS